jgi:hypothetical protein
LAGLEDLLFGVGTVEQSRQGETVEVTRINAGNLPFDETQTLAEVLEATQPLVDSVDALLEIYDNLAEILTTDDLYDLFDDRMLGAKAEDPATDNDGDALVAGTLYWNTTDGELRIYTGTAWTNVPTLVNNLTTDDATKALTAAQGKVLKDLVDGLESDKQDVSEKGQANGYASLDGSGQVPQAQLPSYVDDVIEVATYAALPATGEESKIYIVVADETSGGNTSSYRWTGSVYAMVSNTLTASDIKALYESNADTNEFTDAEKAKVGHITVTQAVDLDTIESDLTAILAGSIGRLSQPLLDLSLQNSINMKAGAGSVTYDAPSTSTIVNRYGILEDVAIDTPAFNEKGMRFDAESTNYALYSEDITNPVWSTVGCDATIDGTLLGGIQATRLEETDTSTAQRRWYDVVPFDDSFGVTTSSMYVKPDADRLGVSSLTQLSSAGIIVDFNLDTMTYNIVVASGTPLTYSASIEDCGDGVYRLISTFTFTPDGDTEINNYWYFSNDATNGNATYAGEVGKGIWAGGAQVEALPYPTSYIPTEASAVTRSQAVTSFPTKNNMPDISKSAGLFIEFTTTIATSFQHIISNFKDGADYWYIKCSNSSLVLQSEIDNSLVCSLASNAELQDNTTYKVCVVFTSGEAKLYINGTYDNSDTFSGDIADLEELLSIPTTLGTFSTSSTSQSFTGYIKSVEWVDYTPTPEEVRLKQG